ncbi:Crp/Fnr family transcriptional regulator [Bernardetia sp.]|uniref:Crp/Fnr family transcriptional regulator n=1 Tax=Bernardetia sp. TaxID=1937974 RepID=UPI0025C56930|nr:Crp/Fnr family transcriptional regulator [Bernardetia sp.]
MVKKFLNSFGILSEKEINDFVQNTVRKKLNKSDFFIREGEVCNEIAFINSGTFRSFYTTNKGEEFTYCIMFPANFIAAYSSFITEEATSENIQAITNAELLVISKNTLDNFAKHSINWLKMYKIIAEQQYIELEKRIYQLQKDNAAERYRDLIENQPQYIQEIPLHYLASYLGITQRHLSRIRKEVVF